MDKDKNGFLSQQEFIVAFMDRDLLCTEKNLEIFYRDFNKKLKQGNIFKEDIKLALPKLDPNDDTLNNLNTITDKDGNERFEKKEFFRIMRYK